MNHLKTAILWMLTIVSMILHFNYHTADFIAGIAPAVAVTYPEPSGRLLIRTVFYHLPFLLIIASLYTPKRRGNIVMLCISILYFAAHLLHFLSEIIKDNKSVSQSSLLFVVLIVAAVLVKEYYNMLNRPATTATTAQ